LTKSKSLKLQSTELNTNWSWITTWEH